VWLVISGPYLQLTTVVFPGLIFVCGRAYVTTNYCPRSFIVFEVGVYDNIEDERCILLNSKIQVILTFDFLFRVKITGTGMENISLTEICWLLASSCAFLISTPIMGHVTGRSQP